MKVRAMIHSKGIIEEVEVLQEREKDYIVKTASGVECTAIYNVFTGLYYADDVYGVTL